MNHNFILWDDPDSVWSSTSDLFGQGPTQNKESLETPCSYGGEGTILVQAPPVAWFDKSIQKQEEAIKHMRRWIATNMREWPSCRWGHEIKLAILVEPAVGGDGEQARPILKCSGCR